MSHFQTVLYKTMTEKSGKRKEVIYGSVSFSRSSISHFLCALLSTGFMLELGMLLIYNSRTCGKHGGNGRNANKILIKKAEGKSPL
jgi:hypothetical protein